jgi:hypothetical protein
MRRMLVLWAVLVGLVVTGCGASKPETFAPISDSLAVDRDEAVPVERAAGASASSVANAQEPVPGAERLIIRSADLQLVVKDTQVALDQITTLVDELGGYVVTSQLTQYDEGARVNLTVRVPAEALDSTLAQFRDWALEVCRQNVTGEDVAEEYSDLQAQLRHLEATEARLLTFLEEAEDTEATLSVYSELQRVQGEIERVKGRIQYLEGAAAMSSIYVELVPDVLAQPISVAGWRPQGTLRQAFEALIRTLQFLVEALIWVLVYIAPVALVVLVLPLAALVWLVRRLRRRQE